MEYSDILIFYSMFLGGCIKLKKRILAIVLSIATLFSCCCVGLYAYAEKKTIEVNKELLESLLTDRYWVIETLANGDMTNNPYREAAVLPNQTMMDDVLERYQTNAAFKALVAAMEVYANTGEYVSGFADDIIATFMDWFSLDDSEGALAVVDDVVSSTAELKYESILNDVIISDYTSSWGETLYEENMDLEYLKQLGSLFGKMSAYQTALKDTVGLHGSPYSGVVFYDPHDIAPFDYKIDMETYTSHFLTAYEQDLEGALVNIVDIPSVDVNEALEKKILAASYLGALYACERVVLPSLEVDLDNIFYNGMFQDTMSVMKGADKALSIADKTMDVAILMESLCSQKTNLVETMGRIETNTTDEDLAKVLNYYGTLVEKQGNAKILDYDVITNYLRNEQVVTDFVSKTVTSGTAKLLESNIVKHGTFKNIVTYKSIGIALEEASAVLNLAVWVADEATGIKDTAKKIYVLRYLDKVINEAKKTFDNDLQIYLNDRTEENAIAVLNDLEFLKELRLYGEKTAYGSMSKLTTSWVGLLLGGGETSEFIKQRHQGMVDSFLGCTLSPISKNKLVLSKGDVLTITSDTFSNNPEKSYTYAVWQKASGETIRFAEPELRCFAGIDLNGAKIRIITADNGLYLPVLNNDTDGSVVEIYCDNVAFGSVVNSKELSIHQYKNGSSYDITDRIENNGTLKLIGCDATTKVNAYEYINSGTINVTDMELNLISTGKNNGTITGMVNVCGGDAYYDNHYFEIERQVLLGNGTYTHMKFTNNDRKGVKIGGKITVTDFISSVSTRLSASGNITLTGSCSIDNNCFKSSLSFKDYENPNSLTVNGDVYIYNTVIFGDALNVNGSMNLTSTCTNVNFVDDVLVKGDLLYNAGVVSGTGLFSVKGDVNITAPSPSIANLNFNGAFAQSFTSSEALTVENLTVSNTSLSGLTVNNVINVANSFTNNSKKITNTNNIILLSDCVYISNGKTKADITITGNYTVKSGETLIVNGNLKMNPGANLTIEDGARVFVKRAFKTSSAQINVATGGSIEIVEYINSYSDIFNVYGSLVIKGDSKIMSSVINADGLISFKGDLYSSSCTWNNPNISFTSNLHQSVSGSAITVNNLTVNNNSKNGVSFGSTINYFGSYDKGDSLVTGESYIIEK